MNTDKNSLEPLIFKPIYKNKIWGGNKISTVLNRTGAPEKNCGESWEVSTVPGNVSVVAGGKLSGFPLDLLIRTFKGDLVGGKVYEQHGTNLPLLMKFIDATDDLSIQVHPDNELALSRHNSLGKTEMWYIIDAEEDATIINGLKKFNDKNTFSNVTSKKFDSIYDRQSVKPGDVAFIPAGTVHAIGKGILLAEIQQSSDITYRIHDYDRKDADGQLRELHLDLAMDAIKYPADMEHHVFSSKWGPSTLVKCDYFTTNHLTPERIVLRDYSSIDSFVVYMMLDGEALLKYKGNEFQMAKGDVYFIPAAMDYMIIDPLSSSKMLEVHC